MTIQFLQAFAPAVLTTSAATYFTMPATPSTILMRNMRVRFTNTDTATHTITAYAVPNAGSAAAGNCIANAESIAPNSHLDLDVPVLKVSETLQAKADAGTCITITALDGVLVS